MNACERCREWVHARIDGDLAGDAARELQAHLESCAACRDEAASLERLVLDLRGAPVERMPDDAFAAVLARTSRASPGRTASFVRRRGAWIGLAAAAGIAAALLSFRPGDDGGPTPEEIAQARRDVQVALALTADALQRAETVGKRVLTEEVSPTLQRVPIRWRNVAESGRRNRT